MISDRRETELIQRGQVATVQVADVVANSRLWPAVLRGLGMRQYRTQASEDMARVDHADLSGQKVRDRGTLFLDFRKARGTNHYYIAQLVEEVDEYYYSRIALLTGWPQYALADLVISTGFFDLDLVVVRHLPYLLQEQP